MNKIIRYLQIFNTTILLLSLLALLTGCGEDSGSTTISDASCNGQPLMSIWVSSHYQMAFDLSNAIVSNPETIDVTSSSGGTCTVSATIIGSMCGGALIVTNSVYNNDGSGDPGCNTFTGTMPFMKASTGDLTLCQEDGNDCWNWTD